MIYITKTGYKVLLDKHWFNYFKNEHLFIHKGYPFISVAKTNNEGKIYTISIEIHRIIMGKKEGLVVDHINGDKLDNRLQNLRFVTIKENTYNRKKKRNCTSKYKGVFWNSKNRNWRSAISKEGKKLNIGSFKLEIEAAKAYNIKALEVFGEFAKLNDLELK